MNTTDRMKDVASPAAALPAVPLPEGLHAETLAILQLSPEQMANETAPHQRVLKHLTNLDAALLAATRPQETPQPECWLLNGVWYWATDNPSASIRNRGRPLYAAPLSPQPVGDVNEQVAKALRNILPMAKGYARMNNFGNNRMMVAEARAALRTYIDECSWSDLRDSGGLPEAFRD